MLKQLIVAAFAAFAFVAAPTAFLPAPDSPVAAHVYAVAGEDEDGDEKKPTKKKRIPHNKKVGLNEETNVFHDKSCKFFTKKLEVMSAKEAKAKGGRPCKLCFK